MTRTASRCGAGAERAGQQDQPVLPRRVVRKDLVRAVKGNAIVPSYVLEYLLGQYAASDDEATIQAGIDTVRKILADHYVHRNQSELVKSTIRERGRHRIIDKVTATLNEKDDVYQAEFANLGIKGVLVEPATIKAHPKLLVGGVVVHLRHRVLPQRRRSLVPWILGSIKPIQLSNFDFEGYLAARREFTTDEWIDLLVQSIGFNPELFGGGPSSSSSCGSSRSSSATTTSSNSAPRAPASPTSSRSSRHTACSSPAVRSLSRSCSSTTPTDGSAWSATGMWSRSTSSPARRSAPTRRSWTS